MTLLNGESTSALEERIVDRINSTYSIPRKSHEILVPTDMGPIPITLTPGVRRFATDSLNTHGIPINLMDDEQLDTRKYSIQTGWDVSWALEAAAVTMQLTSTNEYPLLAREIHYEALANIFDALFSGNGHQGIQNKEILELGLGSGLGSIKLAQKGAKLEGLDYSVMAIEFTNLLARHYNVDIKVEQGDYFDLSRYGDNSKDGVYSSGADEHIKDEQFFKKLYDMVRITRPRGYVVLTVPNDGQSFYESFKESERRTKDRFNLLVQIPVEDVRYHGDPERYIRSMEQLGLQNIRTEGIQVAVSSLIRFGDITRDNPFADRDLSFFNAYLPEQEHPTNPANIVANWSRLEQNIGYAARLRNGWSRVYIGQKPA